LSKLSDIDLEILSLAVDGLTVDQIAKQMNRSPNTIKSRKSRIFQKLEANNMPEATYKAIHQIAEWRQRNPVEA
jgi:DNA-binding NarL/FixJ family response regulator